MQQPKLTARVLASCLLEKWLQLEEGRFERALQTLIHVKGGMDWLLKHPEVFVHPRDTVKESTLGVHQTWDCNLMPFREVQFERYTLYIFQNHIDDLIKD